MSPTFENGETVTVHPFGSGEDPAFGDLIVFRTPRPARAGVTYVGPGDSMKRVIGLPGDTVEVTPDGAILVNGDVVEEPYVAGITTCQSTTQCRWELADGFTGSDGVTCQKDCYFVLGDNRQNSSDSRQGWLVPRASIIGFVRQSD